MSLCAGGPVRVAFITTNLASGGAEKALVNLARGLGARGHQTSLVLLEKRIEHEPPLGVELWSLGATRARRGWLGKRFSAWALKRLLRRLSATGSFDMIVSTLPYCDEVVALARLPRVWYRIANTLSEEIERLRRRRPDKAARRLARYRRIYDAQNLIAVSDGVALDLREQIGLSRANIVRIYNAFDAEQVRGLAALGDPELPDKPYLIHVGRDVPQKRHDLLFDALRRSGLPHQLVLLCAPSSRLDRLIAQHGLEGRVRVAGFKRNPYPWIARAELLVLCSDHEGLPNVLIEALACGTRVLSTDCPSGPREVLQGELARNLVPCGDPVALANGMRDVLARPRPAPVVFRHFETGEVLAQYEALAGSWRGA